MKSSNIYLLMIRRNKVSTWNVFIESHCTVEIVHLNLSDSRTDARWLKSKEGAPGGFVKMFLLGDS
jgi:hypothetical protein